jgi:hypothetical protein
MIFQTSKLPKFQSLPPNTMPKLPNFQSSKLPNFQSSGIFPNSGFQTYGTLDHVLG